MNYRKATPEDASRVMEIIRQAQERMRVAGSAQWQDGYPAPHNIADDLAHGWGMVAVERAAEQSAAMRRTPTVGQESNTASTVGQKSGTASTVGQDAATIPTADTNATNAADLCTPPTNAECIVAYAAVVFDGEPAYDALDGAWLCDKPYVVVHRLAVADHATQRGVATCFMRHIEAYARTRGVGSFRIDTAYENLYMQRMLTSLRFTHCGEVRYGSGLRMAFEKIL